jgi:hypothetical protein
MEGADLSGGSARALAGMDADDGLRTLYAVEQRKNVRTM